LYSKLRDVVAVGLDIAAEAAGQTSRPIRASSSLGFAEIPWLSSITWRTQAGRCERIDLTCRTRREQPVRLDETSGVWDAYSNLRDHSENK
jgi:hypothetical protein